MVVRRKRQYACLTLAKRDLKMEKIRSANDAWKDYSKLHGALPLDPTREAYSVLYDPPVAMTNVLTRVGLWPRAIKLNPS